MIVIKIHGLDEYTVGHYSKNHTENFASLYEVDKDQIIFESDTGYVFHDGVEQTSWNAVVTIEAPEKFQPMEEKVAKYLMLTLKEFSIHLTVTFHYFHAHHQYEHVNKEYPRFLTEANTVNVEENEEEGELYEGNIFKEFEKQLEEKYKNTECDCNDECDCDCDCDDECECEEGECHCGHKH